MTAFDTLVDRFLDDLFADEPALATAVGAPGHDGELPDLTAAGQARRRQREEAWAAEFAGCPDADLSGDERLDRDLALGYLAGRRVLADFEGWRRDPEPYLGECLGGLFALFLHRLRPEPELVDAACSRLAGLPDLLAAARANLDPALAHPVIVRRALGGARGAVGYLRDVLPLGVQDPPARARLAEAATAAAEVVADYAEHLAALAGRAGGGFAVGERRYSALLTQAEGIGYGAGQLHDAGRRAHAELSAEATALAGQVRPGEPWRAVLDRLNADHPGTPEEMRDAYAEWTRRAREFCRERDLVTLPPGESCVVEPAPEFQRAVTAVAFYIPPPALTDRLVGHFFVPYPPTGSSAAEVDARLATNGTWVLPSVAVHEAYPGHHWQLSASAHACPRTLRRVVWSPFLVEGWGLYTERMMAEQGFYPDPRMRLCQVDMRLFRAARIVVDTALHAGDMSVEEAVRYMSTEASLNPETAAAEVARYCATPTQAASYLTGALEIERMRAEWPGSLREFHDRLAAGGSLPLGLAERALRATT